MDAQISHQNAPALGDVRTLGAGDTIWLMADSCTRKDWPRYTEAIASAVSRGADVRWIR